LIRTVAAAATSAAAGDVRRVGDVELERDRAGQVDRLRAAGGGVDRRAAFEQLGREVAAESTVGAGDHGDRVGELHAD
jgi:hypothetical protein